MNVVLAVAESALTAAAREAGYTVTIAASAPEARHLATRGTVDVVVFDPDLAGEGFPAELRRERPDAVVLGWLPVYSSARAAELLELGSDDVLHAAMSRRELLARIGASARKARRPTAESGARLSDLHVDAAHGEAGWRGAPIRLTRRERQVLQVLAEAGGRVVRREEIYRLVWGYAMARGDRTVDVNVRRLRAKLSAVAGDELTIEAEPGIGYRLQPVVESSPVTAL